MVQDFSINSSGELDLGELQIDTVTTGVEILKRDGIFISNFDKLLNFWDGFTEFIVVGE